MINLLIVDDEPLVQAGIKSMLCQDSFEVSVVGTANNGAAAYDMILRYSPEVVITDIKMPVMSGLELAKKCYDEGRTLPVFIFLTSYEEFQFVKQALTYQAVDYLIKLELTPQVLEESLKRAAGKVAELRKAASLEDSSISSIYLLKEQFYTRLVLNLFESEHQFRMQAENLDLCFDYNAFTACYLELKGDKLKEMSSPQQLNLYTSSLQMVQELTNKYLPCHVISLDTKHFSVIFFLDKETIPVYKEKIRKAMEQVSAMLFNYYSVSIRAGIGAVVYSPIKIASSFQDARQIFALTEDGTSFVFCEETACRETLKNVFNISLFKEDIRKAYAEFDEKALYDIFTSIMDLFASQPSHYVQALDAAGNILYLSLSLLSNGEQTVSEIFSDRENGYRSLYELSSMEQILEWLVQLRDGLCRSFATHNKDYKNHIVVQVKKYINEHVKEKLTLNRVAEVFSISTNYLSVLFSKYNDLGFTDYVNQCKVEEAKKMMAGGNMKIYEISDILGFESAFYFSRVFKKVEGKSPREYMNNDLG